MRATSTLVTRKSRRMMLILAALGQLAIIPTASASPGKKIATVDQSGPNPVVQVSATGKKPSQMRIGVENDPAGVKVNFKVTCAKNGAVKQKGSNYTTTSTSDIRKIGLPIKTASSCQLTATVRFTTPPPQTGSLAVTLYSTKQK